MGLPLIFDLGERGGRSLVIFLIEEVSLHYSCLKFIIALPIRKEKIGKLNFSYFAILANL